MAASQPVDPLQLLPPEPRQLARAMPAVPTLPAPLTSFIGRQHEVATTLRLLCEEGRRLVTLTGPGGVGKTRIALQVAERLAPSLRHGVVLASLASITATDHVAAAIGDALHVQATAARPIVPALIHALRDRQTLLVLDNFEQIVLAAPLVAELLAVCPELMCLVASRAPLRISGEQELPIPPLRLPTPEQDLLTGSHTDAVQLFTQRARAIDNTFVLTGETYPAVAAICHRLEGLPLAIELAAARVRVFTPAALLRGLEQRLPLLSDGPRESPVRLRTMRDAIAWSYDLLPPPQQTLFRRLCVFTGGFSLEAALAVSGDPAPDVVDGVTALTAQSLLLRRDHAPGDTPRFGPLETVREFGLEVLAAQAETDDARRAHADWCYAWCRALAPDPIAELGDETTWLAMIDRELPNLRLAFAWLLDNDQPLRLLEMLTWTDLFWTSRVSHRNEVRQWVSAGLAAAPAPPPRLLAGVLHLAVAGTSTLGDHTGAIAFAHRAVRNGQLLDDPFILGRAYYSLGLAYEAANDLEQAEPAYATAVIQFRRIVAPVWTAAALCALGDARHWSGDLDGAAQSLDEGLSLYRQDTQLWGLTMAHCLRGHVALSQRDLHLASQMFWQCLALEAQLGNECLALAAIAGVAGLTLLRGQPERAARLLGARASAMEQRGLACVIARIDSQRILARVQAALPEPAFAAAWEDGLDLSLGEARAEAERIIAARTRASPRARPHDPFGLTQRESEVLTLLVQGCSDREISERMLLGRRTIQTHVAAIFAKLGVTNRTEATATAIRAAMLQGQAPDKSP